jgi:hypothetical protein
LTHRRPDEALVRVPVQEHNATRWANTTGHRDCLQLMLRVEPQRDAVRRA